MSFLRFALLFTLASFLAANPRLTIWSPSDLINKLDGRNEIPITLGHFGYIPWGRALVGHVYKADPIDGCSTLKKIDLHTNDRSPIVIIRRGNCPFATKAYNAQLVGAKLAVIFDDREEDVVYTNLVSDPSGTGTNVHIPIVMIPKRSGEALIQAIEAAERRDQRTPVAIAVSFDWPRNDRPVYEVWMSSGDPNSYEALARFASRAKQLASRTTLEPHFVLMDGAKISSAVENCVSKDRYCAPDPDGRGPLTGKDIVIQDLWQICVYEQASSKFLDYALGFQSCINKAAMQSCGEALIHQLGIDYSSVAKCVQNSWEDSSDPETSDNLILRNERQLFINRGFSSWPQVFINEMPFGGDLNPVRLFDQLCHSFNTRPPECDTPEDTLRKSADPTDYKAQGSIWMIVVLIVVFALVFMGAFYIVYRRIVKRELAKELSVQVNQTVSNYVLMNEKRVREQQQKDQA